MNELKEKSKNGIVTPDYSSSSPVEYTSKKRMSTKKKVAISVGSVLSLIVIALLVIIIINLQSTTIFSHIYIDGIEVSSLTKEQAIEKIKEEKNALLSNRLTLVYNDIKTEITGNDIGAQYDIEKSVDAAYSIGRYGNIFTNNVDMIKVNFSGERLSCDYAYDEEKLNAYIDTIINQFSELQQPSYEIRDNELVITKGKAGNTVNKEPLKESIISALQNGTPDKLQIPVQITEPNAIDIDQIYTDVCKEPVNATYTLDPFEVIPHQDGVNFAISLEEADAILAQDQEEYIIPLTFTKPSVTVDQIGSEAFPDLLASFTTTYIQSKVNRTNNLRVASNSINGVVIMPGETFSYNKTLGPRTVAAGYKMAGVYSGGEEVDGLGGGICQISSNLYNIAIMANLEIVERHNHQFLPGYVDAGQDATVVYGALDFQFKNTRNYPVKIESSVGNGYATVKLFGVKEGNEYDVSFSTTKFSTIYPKTYYEDTTALAAGETQVKSYGQNGCTSETYKVLKQNGVEVSRVKLSSDTYSAKKKVILRGVGEVATVPEPEAEPVQETTVENVPAGPVSDTPTEPTTSTTVEASTNAVNAVETIV